MNGILDDALLGLLLLCEGIDSNNDTEDHCRTQSSNDSSTTLPSNDSNVTHTSDDSSTTPTSSLSEKKRKSKTNANDVIAKVMSDNASSNGYVVKLDEENV